MQFLRMGCAKRNLLKRQHKDGSSRAVILGDLEVSKLQALTEL